jgi:hypothetical protein
MNWTKTGSWFYLGVELEPELNLVVRIETRIKLFLGEELVAEWSPHSIKTEIILIDLLEPKLDVYPQSKSCPVYEQTQCFDAIFKFFLEMTLVYFYYTPLMSIFSCKSMLINCGCMF